MSATELESGAPNPMERAPRKRVLLGAHATFNNEFSSVPCRVKNISQTGALLEFDNPSCVPTNFILHVALEQYKVECRTVRTDQNRVAVEFCGEKQKTNLARSQSLKISDSHSSAAENKEAELREMLQQRRQESLQNLHLEEKKKANVEQPVGRKTIVAFGKRV
ncbi:MAG: PilZ domain-containing protein [Rhizobiaceae bacterium]|nr:PilZ domain-containing protein [Rhizobiaceae bacterium]